MKWILSHALILAGLAAFSAAAQQTGPPAQTPKAPGKEKLSYALGMNLGLQLKCSGVAPDTKVVAQAIRDVLDGKPAEIQPDEIRSVLKQAEAAGHFKLSSKNIAEGEAFLVKNAGADGITTLPDGLQYRVLKTGPGELPKKAQILTLSFQGRWIDGTEFRHNDHLDIPFWGCTKGLCEALQLMKVGSKWEIFVPYNLAYGHLGDQADGFGSVLIYDLELVAAESETAHPNRRHSSGRIGHTMDEDLLPSKF